MAQKVKDEEKEEPKKVVTTFDKIIRWLPYVFLAIGLYYFAKHYFKF